MRMSVKNERFVLWISLVVFAVLTYWPIFSSARLPGGTMSDTVAQGYPFFAYTAERLSQGDLPLWNPYIMCGTPFYESFSAPVFYPLRGLPMLLLGAEATIRFLFPVHFILAGFFAWLFLKAAGVSRWGSWTGAMAYCAGAWANTLFYAGHGSKVICWAWFPLILWAVLKLSRTGKLKYIGLGGLAVGMQGLSSHPQMMLYSAGAAFVLSLFLLKKPLKKSILTGPGGLAVILLIGGALAAVQLLPGYLFSQHTSRGQDLSLESAASYSLPPEETLTMIFPGMFGLRHGFTDSTVQGVPVYFGRLGLRLSSEFTGVAFFLLGLLGLLSSRDRKIRYAMITLCVGGAVVSWGGYTPVFAILYKALPVFRKLRAPHMAAFITTTAIALSAGFGFDALFVAENKEVLRKRVWITLMFLSGLFLILTAASSHVSEALQSSWWARNGVSDTSPYSALVSRRASLLQTDFLRFAAVAAVTAFLIFFLRKKKGSTAVFAITIAAISAMELTPFNRNFQVYLSSSSIDAMFPDAPQLREMAGNGRVFPGGNYLIPLRLRSVTGYHAAKTVETDRLLNLIGSSSPWVIRQTAMSTFASSEGAASWDQIQPALAEGIQGFPDDPMPRAFIPRSIITGSQSEGFQAVESGWNPEIRSVVEESPSIHDGVLGSADIVTDEPELVVVHTVSNMPGFLVLADTWYPGWEAQVDGVEADIYRTNGWMRGVSIPTGEHVVEFRYRNTSILTGGIISIASLLILAMLSLITWKKDA